MQDMEHRACTDHLCDEEEGRDDEEGVVRVRSVSEYLKRPMTGLGLFTRFVCPDQTTAENCLESRRR